VDGCPCEQAEFGVPAADDVDAKALASY